MPRSQPKPRYATPVAVIDTGVDTAVVPQTVRYVSACAQADRISFIERSGDDVGHGTACARIITSVCPEVEIHSVRVVDAELSPRLSFLVAAIEWAVAAGARVINVSLGTTVADEALCDACAAAAEAGVIVVAAEHNEGLVSYPAHLPSVLGVRGGPIRGEDCYQHRPGEPVEWVARGDAQRVGWAGGREVFIGGNSFAAPRIAGVVARLKGRHPDASLEEIRELLRQGASSTIAAAPAGGDSPASVGARSGTDTVDTPARGSGADAGDGLVPGSAVPLGRPSTPLGRPSAPMAAQAGRPGSAPRPRGHGEPQDGATTPHEGFHRVALYPFTKEMHAFVRFPDLLAFELTGIADPPGRGLVGQDAGTAIGVASAGICVQPALREAVAGGDALVLGYLGQLGRLRGRDLRRECLQLAVEKRLHVFSFEPLPEAEHPDLHRQARELGLRRRWPAVSGADLTRLRESAHGPVDVPVLGVFGTSSAQGKFTLQLALRRRLLALGYRVGQVGTEHHAGLFGMDAVFPMGYGSTVALDVGLYPEFLERTLRQLCATRRPDIVVVGAQSGTVPFDVQDGRTLTLPTLAYLLGTKPDACILVVNAIDPADYVADTIAALRALAQTEVIALAVSDRTKEVRQALGRSWARSRTATTAELTQTRARLEARHGLPTVCISRDDDIERLCGIVISHFAAPGAGQEEPCQRQSA